MHTTSGLYKLRLIGQGTPWICFYFSCFSEKMLCWVKPDRVSLSALLSGSYHLQKDDVEIREEFLAECLENDLRPLQQYMTGEAWATLMDEKLNGI